MEMLFRLADRHVVAFQVEFIKSQKVSDSWI